MWALLTAWLRRSWAVVAQWGAIAAAAIGLWFSIRQAGREAERNDQLEAQRKQTEKAHAVENDMRRLDDGAALDELHKRWSRDQ